MCNLECLGENAVPWCAAVVAAQVRQGYPSLCCSGVVQRLLHSSSVLGSVDDTVLQVRGPIPDALVVRLLQNQRSARAPGSGRPPGDAAHKQLRGRGIFEDGLAFGTRARAPRRHVRSSAHTAHVPCMCIRGRKFNVAALTRRDRLLGPFYP